MISKTTTKFKNSSTLRRKMALHIKTDVISSKRHITNEVNQLKENQTQDPSTNNNKNTYNLTIENKVN